jgi:hypothetical protein
MKFLNFFLFLCVIFALLDPDPDPDFESGSRSETLVDTSVGYVGRHLIAYVFAGAAS